MLSRRFKATAISLLLATAIFIPTSIVRRYSQLPFDKYKRLRVSLWTDYIYEYGEIAPKLPYPDSILIRRANEAVYHVANNLIIVITSNVTGLEVAETQVYALYAFPLVVIYAATVYSLTGLRTGLPIIVIFFISVQYRSLHLISSANNIGLVWLLFFTLVLLCSLKSRQGKIEPRVTLLITIVLITYIASDHTLPIATLPFFAAFIFFLMGNINRAASAFLPFAVITFSYYGILYDWIKTVVSTFTAFISNLSLTSYSIFISSSVPPPLSEYLLVYSSSDYSIVYIISAIGTRIGVAIVIFTGIILFFYRIHQDIRVAPIQKGFILGTCIQLIFDFFLSIFFAGSAGIDPRMFALYASPIFAGFVWNSNIFQNERITNEILPAMFNLVVILTILMGLFTVISPSPFLEDSTLDDSSIKQIRWTAEYDGDSIVTSDFRGLSTYYYMGGNNPTFISSSDVYTTGVSRRVVEQYYTNPTSVESGIYIVSKSMVDGSIYHLGGVNTVPSRDLVSNMKNSSRWNTVHSTGDDFVFSKR